MQNPMCIIAIMRCACAKKPYAELHIAIILSMFLVLATTTIPSTIAIGGPRAIEPVGHVSRDHLD